jgi:hypothetical protein
MFLENLIIAVSRRAYKPPIHGRFIGLTMVVCIFFLPLLFLGGLAYYKINNQLNEMTLARRQMIAMPVLRNLEYELASYEEFGGYIALHPLFRKRVEQKDWAGAIEVVRTYLDLAPEKKLNGPFCRIPTV